MVGKFVLPLLGSAPEVWPTTVLFFQAALLAGYAFAHVTARLPARRQALLQLGVLALPALVLPLGVPGGEPPAGNPIPWLLGVLAATAGLPFFALAANGPMVQRWLAATRHRAARDPYFLFAASNGGSLLGLLAYPLLAERLLGLDDQGRAWSVGYALAAVLVAASVAALWLRPAAERSAPASAVAVPERRRRLRAGLLAAAPALARARGRAVQPDARHHQLHHARPGAGAAAVGRAAGALPAHVRRRVLALDGRRAADRLGPAADAGGGDPRRLHAPDPSGEAARAAAGDPPGRPGGGGTALPRPPGGGPARPRPPDRVLPLGRPRRGAGRRLQRGAWRR